MPKERQTKQRHCDHPWDECVLHLCIPISYHIFMFFPSPFPFSPILIPPPPLLSHPPSYLFASFFSHPSLCIVLPISQDLSVNGPQFVYETEFLWYSVADAQGLLASRKDAKRLRHYYQLTTPAPSTGMTVLLSQTGSDKSHSKIFQCPG